MQGARCQMPAWGMINDEGCLMNVMDWKQHRHGAWYLMNDREIRYIFGCMRHGSWHMHEVLFGLVGKCRCKKSVYS